MSQQTTNRYFDELARALASGSISRGKALRLMGAALVGGTLASLGIGKAGADNLCKPEGKKCRKDAQCCSRNCDDSSRKCAAGCGVNGASCATSSGCCSGLVCKGPSGQGTCVESCIPPNAIPCDISNPTAACGPNVPGGCGCIQDISGGGFCANNANDIRCTTSCDCPAGQFCDNGGLCVFVADVCPTA
jgi:hypothetical protein